jgi:hypothetical protein
MLCNAYGETHLIKYLYTNSKEDGQFGDRSVVEGEIDFVMLMGKPIS